MFCYYYPLSCRLTFTTPAGARFLRLLPVLLFVLMLKLSTAQSSPPERLSDSKRDTGMAMGAETAHDAGSDSTRNIKIINGFKVENSAVVIDGHLNEEVWSQAELATGFIQTTPNDGEPATEKTEVRVLYDDAALYIGARLYESDPDNIAATLFRRDGGVYSDWFLVGIDSYNDRRTAFVFGVNPRGVKKDFLAYNDTESDPNWDAVWETTTIIDKEGWTAEFRIPFSQLRYNGSNGGSRNWGINFARERARNDETSFWSPVPVDSDAMVSRFGRLKKLQDLPSLRRLEIMPYTSGRLDRTPQTGDNPFLNEYGTSFDVGADIKYGINSNVTLTATINPDFGQVEVDPAVVNLSAYETFFPEQRPFFLEGNEIFSFGFNSFINMGDSPNLFYSRRIGRAPQGTVPDEARYSDIPSETPIAGAVKISGKTSAGWSVGMLNALTLEQSAEYELPDGQIHSASIEPLANYTVMRVKRDFRDGQTVVGLMGNGVYRDLSDPSLASLLADRAGSAGLDFEQSWNERKYRINGRFAVSHVSGNKEVIDRLQHSSARYFQRPDAEHLEVDQMMTNLQGTLSDVMVIRQTRHWMTQVRHYRISPGFEVNDLGFQQAADRRTLTGIHIYEQPSPQGVFQNWSAWIGSLNSWNTTGDHLFNMHGFGGHMRFRNFWSVNTQGLYQFESYDDRLTRGGPIAARPAAYEVGLNIHSDSRKDFRVSAGTNQTHTPDTRDRRENFYVRMQYRPHPAVNLSIQPSLRRFQTGTQYVTTVDDPAAEATYGRRYVFAYMDQQTISTTIRADWTFTPNISFQLYVQPFISAGDYTNFKELSRPGKYDYAVYGTDSGSISYDEEENRYEVDPDGSGSAESFEFGNPDFKMRSLRGNAVFRWEFRPGSTMYLVWQQSREYSGNDGTLRLGNDYTGIFDSPANHTFLIKVSYWMGY